MPPKYHANKDHNTRSRSVSRNRGQGSVPAASNTPHASLQDPQKGSPSREGKHPPEVESSASTTVSKHQDATSSTISAQDTIIDMSKVTVEDDIPTKHIDSVKVQNPSPPSHARSDQVSDNREMAIQTDFPPEFPPPLLQEGAVGALTSELRAIRS